MRRVVTLQLPLPYRQLSPNARVGRHEKIAYVRLYRQLAYSEALNARRRLEKQGVKLPIESAAVHLHWRLAHGRRDWDNCVASFKAGLDGVVDAGLLVSDSMKDVSVFSLSWSQGRPERVELSLLGPEEKDQEEVDERGTG